MKHKNINKWKKSVFRFYLNNLKMNEVEYLFFTWNQKMLFFELIEPYLKKQNVDNNKISLDLQFVFCKNNNLKFN
jgi:hypothetical protein